MHRPRSVRPIHIITYHDGDCHHTPATTAAHPPPCTRHCAPTLMSIVFTDSIFCHIAPSGRCHPVIPCHARDGGPREGKPSLRPPPTLSRTPPRLQPRASCSTYSNTTYHALPIPTIRRHALRGRTMEGLFFRRSSHCDARAATRPPKRSLPR